MNANARLWIDNLRSGAYRQTSNHLRQRRRFGWRKPAFCAIGVLYDLYLKSRGEKWPAKSPSGHLPQSVLDWVGISRELECEVVSRNDRGMSFRDIASIIEAHLHRAERDRGWREAGAIAGRMIGNARAESRRRMQLVNCQISIGVANSYQNSAQTRCKTI